ncbi:MAG: hypothetical protein SNH94_03745 [Rikenellaceae bacterium]
MSNELKLGFYLRHKEIKSDGSVPIMGRITIGRTMVQFGAKCSVAERLWDTKSARAVGKSKVATELNRNLDKISLAIHTHYKELIKRKASTTATEVKNAFQGIASGQETLLQFCERYYDKLGERVGVTLSYNGRYAYRNLSQAKDGVWWIHSKRQKTGSEFHVPLLDVPMQIIERYRGTADGDHLFRVFSGVTMNIQLKKITKICGIARDITYHQARHSYASLITLS